MAEQKMSFEAALARLEEVLQALESGESTLDEMLKLYEEGVGLIRVCNGALEQAELSVKMLRMSPDGGVELADLKSSEE